MVCTARYKHGRDYYFFVEWLGLCSRHSIWIMVAPVFISGRTNHRALKTIPLFPNSKSLFYFKCRSIISILWKGLPSCSIIREINVYTRLKFHYNYVYCSKYCSKSRIFVSGAPFEMSDSLKLTNNSLPYPTGHFTATKIHVCAYICTDNTYHAYGRTTEESRI